jgi:vacuolar-type H+-ATPase subunit H
LAREKALSSNSTYSQTAGTDSSSIESIVASLSSLETDIDKMYVRAEEMKKKIIAGSNEQIEQLRQQITSIATEEAKQIVEKARLEAEAESAEITKQAERGLNEIKKNIDSSFERAVSSIVKTVIGESPQDAPSVSKGETQGAKASPTTPQPKKIKRYTSDGKVIG